MTEQILPNDFWYCDDIIPKSTQTRLKNYVTAPLFNWNDFNQIHTAGVYDMVKYKMNFPEVQEVPSSSLIKLVYVNDGYNGKIFEEKGYAFALAILDEYAKRTNVIIKDIMRIKLNCQTKSIFDNYDVNSCNEIHIDNETPNNKTLLYYINDSDGDTFLFDKIWNQTDSEFDLSVLLRAEPKQGRAITFDTWRFHAPSNPIYTQRRYVMNINFLEERIK